MTSEFKTKIKLTKGWSDHHSDSPLLAVLIDFILSLLSSVCPRRKQRLVYFCLAESCLQNLGSLKNATISFPLFCFLQFRKNTICSKAMHGNYTDWILKPIEVL